MKLSIPANLIRAAQTCQASKDVRPYLNGILLAKNGDIVASDGHTMCQTRSQNLVEAELEHDLVVSIEGKIPVTAIDVEFDFGDDLGESGVVVKCITTTKPKLFNASVIGRTYANYKRGVPQEAINMPDDQEQVIGLNPDYIARAAVFMLNKNSGGVSFHIAHPHSPMVITPCDTEWPNGTRMIIMPVKSKGVHDIRDSNGNIIN